MQKESRGWETGQHQWRMVLGIKMSKEADSIIRAWRKGDQDRVAKKPYKNPYNKNSQRAKHKAYSNGYHS